MTCEHKESLFIEKEYGIGWFCEHRRCLSCGVDYRTVITRTQAAIDFSGTAHARNTDPQTSKDSAKRLKVSPIEKRIYETLTQPMTTHEVADASGIPYWTVTPRMKPMERKGIVARTGGTRRSPESKRELELWIRA